MYNIGGYQTHWGASDVLSYYGSILGGLATLIAVLLTIRHSTNNIKKDNARRDNERKEERMRDRIIFVSGLFYNMLAKLDASHFLNSFRGKFEDWTKHPMEIFHYFDNAHRYVNIDINFVNSEKELMTNEIQGLVAYAKKYSEHLWDFHILLLGWKNIEKQKAFRLRIDAELNSSNSMKRQIASDSALPSLEEDLDKLIDRTKTLDIGAETIENLESRQSEIADEVFRIYSEIVTLYSNEYKSLNKLIHDTITKLENKLKSEVNS